MITVRKIFLITLFQKQKEQIIHQFMAKYLLLVFLNL